MLIPQIARICHEVNRALCESFGDNSQRVWDKAEGWQRDSAIKGVEFRLNNPDAPQSAQHDAWMQDKVRAGWKYGPVKDSDKLEHPCLVPFDKLPPEQKAKDAMFCAVVDTIAEIG